MSEKKLLPKRLQQKLKFEFDAKLQRSNIAAFLHNVSIIYKHHGPPEWVGFMMASNTQGAVFELGWAMGEDGEIQWNSEGKWGV